MMVLLGSTKPCVRSWSTRLVVWQYSKRLPRDEFHWLDPEIRLHILGKVTQWVTRFFLHKTRSFETCIGYIFPSTDWSPNLCMWQSYWRCLLMQCIWAIWETYYIRGSEGDARWMECGLITMTPALCFAVMKYNTWTVVCCRSHCWYMLLQCSA
jgi:hypothetical protein